MEVFISNTLKRYFIYEHYSFYTVYLNFKGFVTVSCVAVKAEPRDKGWTKEDCFIFDLKMQKLLKLGSFQITRETQNLREQHNTDIHWRALRQSGHNWEPCWIESDWQERGSKTEHNTNKTWGYQNKKGIDTYKHNETKIKTGELDSRTGDKPNGDMADWGDKGAKQKDKQHRDIRENTGTVLQMY